MDQQSSRSGRRPLKRMFDSVPGRYDLLNRILTLRLDERWRRRAAKLCLSGDPRRVMDICCGTGDLALHLRRLASNSVEIVGLDFSAAMLEIARQKALKAGFSDRVAFVEGDATSLEFPDGHFDAVGIAFGFRNLTWKNPISGQALAEVRRVLRPGGAFVIVETSQPTNRLLRAGFHSYLRIAVSSVGGAISGNSGAYRYLSESARRFFSAADVSSLLVTAGFEVQAVESLLGGAAAIHVAINPG